VKEKLYTVKQASEILGVHPKTIQKRDREGKIKVVRTPGGRRRIPESEIKRLLGEKEKTVKSSATQEYPATLKRTTLRGKLMQ